jgi:hypothetical protein
MRLYLHLPNIQNRLIHVSQVRGSICLQSGHVWYMCFPQIALPHDWHWFVNFVKASFFFLWPAPLISIMQLLHRRFKGDFCGKENSCRGGGNVLGIGSHNTLSILSRNDFERPCSDRERIKGFTESFISSLINLYESTLYVFFNSRVRNVYFCL